LKRLHDVFFFEVRVVAEDLIHSATSTDLADDHTDGDAYAPNAGFAPHHTGLLGDSIKWSHRQVLINILIIVSA
jgi:hypothetical protein